MFAFCVGEIPQSMYGGAITQLTSLWKWLFLAARHSFRMTIVQVLRIQVTLKLSVALVQTVALRSLSYMCSRKKAQQASCCNRVSILAFCFPLLLIRLSSVSTPENKSLCITSWPCPHAHYSILHQTADITLMPTCLHTHTPKLWIIHILYITVSSITWNTCLHFPPESDNRQLEY